MHFSSTQLVLAVAPIAVNAFPTAILAETAGNPALLAQAEKMLGRRQAGAGAATLLFEPIPIFSEKQYVNISKGSGHEYVAPGPNDLRGPCPGLNAFANHASAPPPNFTSQRLF